MVLSPNSDRNIVVHPIMLLHAGAITVAMTFQQDEVPTNYQGHPNPLHDDRVQRPLTPNTTIFTGICICFFALVAIISYASTINCLDWSPLPKPLGQGNCCTSGSLPIPCKHLLSTLGQHHSCWGQSQQLTNVSSSSASNKPTSSMSNVPSNKRGATIPTHHCWLRHWFHSLARYSCSMTYALRTKQKRWNHEMFPFRRWTYP